MKQKIDTIKPVTEPITDLDVVFTALYNLLYEKIEEEPKKGIIVSKGNPNQRKVLWKNVMVMAHSLEDFFILREQRTGSKSCEECVYWESVSKTSPHLGRCNRYDKKHIHKYHSCKKGFTRRNDYES